MHIIDISLQTASLAATSFQRFQAVKQLDRYSDHSDFTRYCVFAVGILLILLIVVSLRRISRERKINLELFYEYAEQRGLSRDEKHILLQMTKTAGLRLPASIFSAPSHFDIAIEKIKKHLFAKQNIDEINALESVFSSLRTKLGFQKEASFSKALSDSAVKASTREIPIGKELILERITKQGIETINAKVIGNDENELAVQLGRSTVIIFGESWKGKYYEGASIWEFDSFVRSYDGNIMGLSHSEDVRFINRRRFNRTAVRRKAFIASFPFEKTYQQSIHRRETENTGNEYPEITFQPLEFVAATITELGGPGLKIETSLRAQKGDRVLIIFELESKKERSFIKNQETEEITQIYTTTLKVAQNAGMVEEAGIVRRIGENSDSYMLAVELIGLHDKEIDCLIRATNEAAIINEHTESLAGAVG